MTFKNKEELERYFAYSDIYEGYDEDNEYYYISKYDYLEPETHKFKNYEWHRKYKNECFEMFNYRCSGCDKYINIYEGVVHHKTYKHKGGIYQARPKEIKDKICLMCYECHEGEHRNKSIDGITRKIPREYKECIDCNDSDYYEPNLIQSDGRCETCHNTYVRDMSEYIF